MDPLQLFASSGLVIVAGKGGVGKTTVTAAMAIAAARVGRRVLVIELEGASGLGPLLGADRPLRAQDLVLRPPTPDQPGSVSGRVVSPGEALTDYLDDHGMRRLSGRLAKAGVIDVVATAAPGLDDILVLGKVKQLERAGTHDLILLDAPAAGHALTFLRSAKGLADAVTVGPIATQAQDVLELLGDADRCQVVLVTLPEETPVNEIVETAFALEDEVGVKLGPDHRQRALPGPTGAGGRTGRGGRRRRPEPGAGGRASAWPARLSRPSRWPASRPACRSPRSSCPSCFTAGLTADDLERLADRLLEQLGAQAA